MTRYVCDRCGATRPGGVPGIYASGNHDDKHLFVASIPGTDGAAAHEDVELCDDCVRALWLWLKGGGLSNVGSITGTVTSVDGI